MAMYSILDRMVTAAVVALVLATGAVATASASADAGHEREVPEPVEVCLSCHAIAAHEPVLRHGQSTMLVGVGRDDCVEHARSGHVGGFGHPWQR
jgi:hypothetical protein